MKKSVLLATLICCISQLQAQSYMTAGGLRLGTDWGLTLQQRLTKNITFEGIVQSSLQREEVLLTGMLERHYALVFRGLNLYAGGGLHKGWYNSDEAGDTEADGKDPFGLTFVGGAELTLGRLNFSYDFKPAINLTGGERTFYTQTGVSIRYVLVTNKKYKKRQREKRKKQRRERRKENGGIHIGDDWKIWKKEN